MTLYNDLHVHTNLSLCADKTATVQAYMDRCNSEHIDLIGFANHLWDSKVSFGEFSSNAYAAWYARQGVEHVLSLKRELEECKVKVLMGCETEFLGKEHVGITRESACFFDYILIPTSHVHMAGFVRPKYITSVEDIRKLLIERFCEACVLKFDVPVGMAHPFHPLGFQGIEQDILSGISDDVYKRCFNLAAENGRSIEIHISCLGSKLDHNKDGFAKEYVRMYTIAKSEGTFFHFGSDAHKPDSDFNVHDSLRAMAHYCGITENHMFHFA